MAPFSPPPFHARPPWVGGDLQTLRDSLVQRPRRTAAMLASRPAFAVAQVPLGDGDRLRVAIDPPATATARGTVAIVHGLTGCEGGPAVTGAALALIARGWRTLRLNLRGAGPGRPLARGHYHGGRTADLGIVFAWARAAYPAGPFCAVGHSLGGAAMLKHLGEAGPASVLDAAASVCAPIDLAAAAARMDALRNRFYVRHMLARMRAQALAPPAAIPHAVRAATRLARTVRAFDNAFTAPMSGFADASDFYARCSSKPLLPEITRPTLALAARNDPLIPAASYEGVSAPNVQVAMVDGGGHVGFHSAHDDGAAWRDRVIADWFDHVFASRSATSAAK